MVAAGIREGDRVTLASGQGKMSALATAFEERIGRWPEDWHMLATLWTDDRSSRPTMGA